MPCARLQELLPLVERLDAVVAEIVPAKPGRGRRWGDGEEGAFTALRPLPVDLADEFRSAIDNLESELEDRRGAAEEAMREELEEAEERVRELRRRLGEEPGDAPAEGIEEDV